MTTMTGFDKFNNGFSKGFLNASDAFKRSMMSISSLASHCLLNIMITNDNKIGASPKFGFGSVTILANECNQRNHYSK